MIMERRSAPIRTLSVACSKSSIRTDFWLRRAASSAASLTMLARSAPEKPGVPRPSTERATSRASGILRTCTLRISLRPLKSARPAPPPPRPPPAGEARGGRAGGAGRGGGVGGGDEDDAFVGVEPVHLHQ